MESAELGDGPEKVMISIVPTTDEHLKGLWEILSELPEFFSEEGVLETFEDFSLWFLSTTISPLTSLVDDEVIGCGYLDQVYQGYWGSVNLFKRPGRERLIDVVEACRGACIYWMELHRLEKLVGVIRDSNLPSRLLARRIGFKRDGVLRHHKMVDGEWRNYILTSALRGEL
jgi:hypothetical protein